MDLSGGAAESWYPDQDMGVKTQLECTSELSSHRAAGDLRETGLPLAISGRGKKSPDSRSPHSPQE